MDAIRVVVAENMLFDAVDTRDYDIPASLRQFRDELINVLYDEYPNAELDVTVGDNELVMVDSETTGHDVDAINFLIDGVWASAPWDVEL